MRLAIAACVLLAALCAAYLPDLGRGFIKDDFRWIRTSRIASVDELPELLTRNVGFYRPAVSASFALNYAASGLEPLAYGFTNFGLLLAAAGLLFLLARQLELPHAAALLAAAVWVFNFHGINMAMLWISGRTALLLCVAALATALCALGGRAILAGVFCLLALLSKEEAVVLPFVLAVWLAAGRRMTWRAATRTTWPLFAALAAYAVLRSQSGAFGPIDAPPYYQFTFTPNVVLGNMLEYVDRAATWPAIVVAIILAAAQTIPRFTADERATLLFGALWFTSGYALTVFIPARSSLYAVFPSIGACLAAGIVATALLRERPQRVRRTLAALVVLPLVLLPVYRARNVRWVTLADLSSSALADIRRAAASSPGARRVVLIDDPAARFNLDAAFGTLLPDALALTMGDGFEGEIVRDGGPSDSEPPDGTLDLIFRNGELNRHGAARAP